MIFLIGPLAHLFHPSDADGHSSLSSSGESSSPAGFCRWAQRRLLGGAHGSSERGERRSQLGRRSLRLLDDSAQLEPAATHSGQWDLDFLDTSPHFNTSSPHSTDFIDHEQ